MHPFELPARSVDDVLRLVRALGTHRYVAGRLHLVHAFVFEALAGTETKHPALWVASEWAHNVLRRETLDVASKDEALWRAASAEELAAAIEGFWRPGAAADRAHDRLLDRLEQAEIDLEPREPFDETDEDDIHPLLIDAGWELLPLASLDADKHKGAIASFGEPIDFDAARFEEENAIPKPSYLQELPALGAIELLRGMGADGTLVAPLTLWTEGSVAYHDYVVRGALRAAKL